jgi:hypothetical protein
MCEDRFVDTDGKPDIRDDMHVQLGVDLHGCSSPGTRLRGTPRTLATLSA